jgi:hypothetical protein
LETRPPAVHKRELKLLRERKCRTLDSSCARRRVAPMELAEVTRRKDADEQRAQPPTRVRDVSWLTVDPKILKAVRNESRTTA